MDSALDLLQKTPPSDLEKNLKGITILTGSSAMSEGLEQRLHLPISVSIHDDEQEEELSFLQCAHNRVGNSYRSPWTHRYYPELANPPEIPQEVLMLEHSFNEVWREYRQLYYGKDASVGSVYFADRNGVLDGYFGIQKNVEEGSWSSVHLVQISIPNQQNQSTYQIHSTVLLSLINKDADGDEQDALSACLTKDTNKSLPVVMINTASSHIENVGRMLEDIETELRSNLERIHLPKTRETLESIQREEIPGVPIPGIQSHPLFGSAGFPTKPNMGVPTPMMGATPDFLKQKTAALKKNPKSVPAAMPGPLGITPDFLKQKLKSQKETDRKQQGQEAPQPAFMSAKLRSSSGRRIKELEATEAEQAAFLTANLKKPSGRRVKELK